MQAALSEEENCTLLCELPYYQSSLQASTHAINSGDEIQSSQPSDPPRYSTVFTDPGQADHTNHENVDISLEPHQGLSIVQPGPPKQSTPSGSRVRSDRSSLEDFSPIDSRYFHRGPHVALEPREGEENISHQNQETSAVVKTDPIINSKANTHSTHSQVRKSNPKQNETRTRVESISSDEFEEERSENTSTSSSREDSPVRKLLKENYFPETEENMDPHLIKTLIEALQKIGQQQQTSIVVPETIKIQPFRGLDGDDVIEWFEVFENRLKRRRIALDSEGALTELALHLAGPAKEFYSDLYAEEKATLEDVKRIMVEHYSSRDHDYGQREYLLNRRQAPSESLDHYLTDICSKFRHLGLTNKGKMSYFLQGLRSDIRQLVYMKEPKTFTEAEKAARFAESISRVPQSSNGNAMEHELIAKLLNKRPPKMKALS